jgi:hypothetical protein
LVGEEDSGPQSYSPKCIRRAKAVQAEIEAKEQANRQRIADKKVVRKLKKLSGFYKQQLVDSMQWRRELIRLLRRQLDRLKDRLYY